MSTAEQDAEWERIRAKIDEAKRVASAPTPPIPMTSNDAAETECELFDLAALPDIGEDDEPLVINGLLRPGGIVIVVGEEGDGKTTFTDQLCRQLANRDSIMGIWSAGELAPERILFADTHQERGEVLPKAQEMDRRGLSVEPGRVHWWLAGRMQLDDPENRKRLEERIVETGADFLWIDAGAHCVRDPKDDVEVTALFDYLSSLQRGYDLKGIGMTLFPRKRPAQGYTSRTFDDLFGSREWKGRTSVVLYLDASKLVAFKDRPGFLRRSWPKITGGRYPAAKLERTGLGNEYAVPFHIVAEMPDAEIDREEARAKAIQLVADRPETYSKTSLAGALGIRKGDGLGIVEAMLEEGVIGPRRSGAKLRVMDTQALFADGLEVVPDAGNF
jgi:hypothetical protein